MCPFSTVLALAASLPLLFAGIAAPQQQKGAAAKGAQWLGNPPHALVRRVVSLAPSLTDEVIALGKTDLLVGVTRYDKQAEVAHLPRVGGFVDPSPEAVLALQPDLVLWVTDGGALPGVKHIASLGVPVLAIPIITVSDVVASARLVGAALGDAPAGERLARSLSLSIGMARERAARGPPVRVLFIVGREPLVVAGPGSYPDELIRLAGGRNVAKSDRPWPVYPLENAVADNPDLVIDGAVLEPPEGLERLAAIPAVKRGNVHRLLDDSALRPGPRLAHALDELTRALHPQGRER
ncbi:MAG TPA: helical backbone metal receptor [Anaeromyxobacteraceae bacterium]|nr:helical backbone metal receptor [Anaeromyxobacteraceae bacterium]